MSDSQKMPRRGSLPEQGFSLIELLVVVAILGVMISFAVPGFNNIAVSRGVGQAASDISGILELARNEAVTRQTYVWAVFQEATNTGTLEIQMALAGSIDGTPTAAATNLAPLSRVVRVQNVGLTSWVSLVSATTNVSVDKDLVNSVAGITYTNLSTKFTKKATITFTPRGEAMVKGQPSTADGFDPLIGIGIVPARGDVKQTAGLKDDSGVLLDGSTGMSRVFRVQ